MSFTLTCPFVHSVSRLGKSTRNNLNHYVLSRFTGASYTALQFYLPVYLIVRCSLKTGVNNAIQTTGFYPNAFKHNFRKQLGNQHVVLLASVLILGCQLFPCDVSAFNCSTFVIPVSFLDCIRFHLMFTSVVWLRKICLPTLCHPLLVPFTEPYCQFFEGRGSLLPFSAYLRQ